MKITEVLIDILLENFLVRYKAFIVYRNDKRVIYVELMWGLVWDDKCQYTLVQEIPWTSGRGQVHI